MLSQNFQAAWDILETWAKKNEQERRKLLRPHWEREIEERDERVPLDTTLDELTILEIALQTGSARPRTFKVVKKCASLFKSEAFTRYLNGYANFGIRFWRISFEDADLEVSSPSAIRGPVR